MSKVVGRTLAFLQQESTVAYWEKIIEDNYCNLG
jgi:hypothetical protein